MAAIVPIDANPAVVRFSVLVADDDAVNRATVAEILAKQGFDTLTAADGKEAVQVFQACAVHLALFDMHMPRLTGLQALRLLKRIDQHLPAILMTANSSPQLLAEAAGEGIYTVLEKPVHKVSMLASLRQALSLAYPNHPTLLGDGLR
jgi:CheY-like chemotaxis protein